MIEQQYYCKKDYDRKLYTVHKMTYYDSRKEVLQLAYSKDYITNLRTTKRRFLLAALRDRNDAIIAREKDENNESNNPILCCIIGKKTKEIEHPVGIGKFTVIYSPFFYIHREFEASGLPDAVLGQFRLLNKNISIIIDLPETFIAESLFLASYCKRNNIKCASIMLDKVEEYTTKSLRMNENLPDIYRFWIESYKSTIERQQKQEEDLCQKK